VTPEEVEIVLAEMRGGQTFIEGVSRCHTEFRWRDGQWWAEEFDEGPVSEAVIDEARMRAAIEYAGESLRPIIERPIWRRVLAAWLGGNRESVTAALAELRYDPHRFAVVIPIALGRAPTADERILVAETVSSHMAYHAVMTAAEYRESPEVAQLGLALCDAFGALVGGSPQLTQQREWFEKMVAKTR
jgi:hypothetical protein